MDRQTRDYYRLKAAELARRYDGARGGIADCFDGAFPRGGRVLDVGAGSGRDLHRLLLGGWDGWGVEPCRALIDEAERLYPAVRGRIRQSALPALEGIGDGRFDGVVASAVLMHLAERQLKASLRSLRRVLKGRGRLLVSLPVDDGGKAHRGRDEEGRFFNGLSPERLETLLAELGFACMVREQKADGLGRKDRNWAVQLFEL
jgi:SAM-dependent methyltransferase